MGALRPVYSFPPEGWTTQARRVSTPGQAGSVLPGEIPGGDPRGLRHCLFALAGRCEGQNSGSEGLGAIPGPFVHLGYSARVLMFFRKRIDECAQ
jgi:hypothetical protein